MPRKITITFNFVHDFLLKRKGWTFAGETIGLALGCWMEQTLFAARRGTVITSQVFTDLWLRKLPEM